MGKLSIEHCSLLVLRIATLARPTIGGVLSRKVLFNSTLRKLPGKEWSDQEAEKLRDLVQQYPSIYLVPNLEAEFPGRTRNEILWKLVEEKPKRVPWSDEEDQIIKASRFAGESWVSIQKKVTNRSATQISYRFHKLMAPMKVKPPVPWAENSGKPWSSEEIAELIRVRDDDGLSWDEIVKRFGRSKQSVLNAYTRNYVPLTRPWSEKEVHVLNELVDAGKTYPEISKILDRTVLSVAMKRMGVWKQRPTGKRIALIYTQAETAIIKEAMKQGLGAASIMSKFPHRTFQGIQRKMQDLREKGLNNSERRREKDAGENGGRALPSKRGTKKHHNWSKADITIFEAALDEGLSEQQTYSKLPHVPPSIIRARWEITKKTGHGDSKQWSREENAIITRAIRNGVDKAQLQTKLPRRTWAAIWVHYTRRRQEIGLKEGTHTVRYSKPRWTADEEAMISEAIQQGLSPKDVMGKLPSRAKCAVRAKWGHVRRSMESSE